MKQLYIFSILCFFLQSLYAQDNYFPEKGMNWQTKTPPEMGFNSALLQEAIDSIVSNEYKGDRNLKIAILEGFAREPYHYLAGPTKKRGAPAGIIIKNGYIVAKWGDINRVDMTFSVTKSYLSTVAGLAYDNSWINSVEDKVSSYVWDKTFAGAHNSKITWEHLLNQSSDWSGELFGMKDWADRPPREGGIDDWKNRKYHVPGTNFEYNDVRVNVLAYSLLQVWRKPLPQVLKNRIMDPIGASSTWRWYGYENSWVNIDGVSVQSVSGGGHSGGGVFINTLDQARFGLLFMNNGNWDGEQLISKDWIEMATTPSKANQGYGFMWWLNKGERAIEGLPENIFWGAGFGGNYVVIDPENKILIVTRWLEPSKMKPMIKMIYKAME